MDTPHIVATGAVINFGAGSTSVPIPNASAGGLPNFVRLVSTQACYVRLGVGGATAVAGDLLVQPSDSVTVVARNCTHVAAMAVGTGGVLQISPLENSR